jgi:hypothetical protein
MTRISNILFISAAVLALLGVAAHELLGAPKVLGPLKASGLPDNVVWLHHFSWHVGSVAVLAMIALFLLAVYSSRRVCVRRSGHSDEPRLCRTWYWACDLWQSGSLANPGTLPLDADRRHRRPGTPARAVD